MKTVLPQGWRMERLGLISGVNFSKENRSLLWTDGQWFISIGGKHSPAPGVPHANDMKQAATVGAAWLVEVES